MNDDVVFMVKKPEYNISLSDQYAEGKGRAIDERKGQRKGHMTGVGNGSLVGEPTTSWLI